jgi:hypothetical protein
MFSLHQLSAQSMPKREREPRALSAKGEGGGKDRKRSRGVKRLTDVPRWDV